LAAFAIYSLYEGYENLSKMVVVKFKNSTCHIVNERKKNKFENKREEKNDGFVWFEYEMNEFMKLLL
jgi:nitrate/TMAO reductase-like tetraheme cytochrome c subunit